MFEIITENALEKLNELCVKSTLIKGAVAYWTFAQKDLHPLFSKGLAAPGGFLCCDVHSPTSIGTLAKLHDSGAQVYLHLFQLVGKTETSDSKGIPDHLMHSKVFVFEDGSDECVIWIGSHNGTARALLGINFECAVVFRVSKSSQIYRDVHDHLEEIRLSSTCFDPADIEHYRLLQGMSNADAFIEVVDNYDPALKPGTEISIFGADPADHRDLKNVGKKIYLAVTYSVTGKETLYAASITQSGELKGNEVAFSARRFAYRSSRALPELEAKKTVPKIVYDGSKFFVTVKVGEPLDGVQAIEAPPLTLWDDLTIQQYLGSRKKRVAYSDNDLHKVRPNLKARIQVARAKKSENFAAAEKLQWDRAFTVLAFNEKKVMVEHPLVRRRIIKDLENGDSNGF